MSRRLAAILIADVVGYSRLVELDEAGTLATLKSRRRNILAPSVARHHGRLVKVMGDGVLIEFASAVEAVECAIDLQKAFAEANHNLAGERAVVLRIGVNLGDVIVEGNDLYGDGVNVAARLQALAEPGSICISRSINDQVRGKTKAEFEDIGEHQLKNISVPVRVYRAVPAAQLPSHTAVAATGKPSIAVLPFDNMSGNPEQDYFADGLANDIITGLSRFRELLVIARNSSFMFRGKSLDIKNLAQKLGVQFVITGSVLKSGNRVRVTVQLIDTASNAHVWAERYDRDLSDIFEIQDEITRMVTSQVAGRAIYAAVRRIRSRPTESLSAYDYFLKAREMFGHYESFLRAEPLLEKALELDPNFASAHALNGLLSANKFFYDGKTEHLEKALISGRKAQELDPEEPWASYLLCLTLTNMRRHDEAGHYIDQAIALNPNNSASLAYHAMWMSYVGQSDSAIREIDEALRRDPYGNDWFWDVRGMVLTAAGRPKDAIESFKRMQTIAPWGYCYLAICHVELGQMAEARACLKCFKALHPQHAPEQYMAAEPFTDRTTIERFANALRQASQEPMAR